MNFAVADGETMLVDGVANALREVGLEFHRRHWQAVQEQHEVDAVLVVLGVMHLPDNTQSVGGVPSQDIGVDPEGRFELCERQLPLQAEHLRCHAAVHPACHAD